MKKYNNRVSEINIAYIGGGSRGWAWTFMTDLALDDQISGTIRLYDLDKKAAENNEIIGNHLMQRDDAKGNWKFVVSDSMKEALTGCNFVVISILPGTFDEMAVDVHMPERLGIYQSVGDTAGPGGIIRALRTIPMYVEIAEAIRDYSPEAWVINYTNPMSLCVRTLYYVFPGIKAFGCCHEVFGTQKVLQGIYENVTGEKIGDWHDIYVDVLGINHFTWFSGVSYKGTDIFPIYREYIDKHFNEGFEEQSDNWMNSSFNCANRVKMDLFNRYGWIAAAGDRHLAEFMPGNEYLNDPETVKRWKFQLTSVDWRKEDLQQRLDRSRKLASFEEEVKLEPTGEEGISLIKALCGLERLISNVNIPNSALQVSNLPADAVVETNAVFELDKIHPIMSGSLPRAIYDLELPHVENHDRTLRAALTGDRNLVVESFEHDPNVKGHNLTHKDVEKLVCDMIAGTKNYLPEYWK